MVDAHHFDIFASDAPSSILGILPENSDPFPVPHSGYTI